MKATPESEAEEELSLMSKVKTFLKSKTVEMSEKVYEKCLGAYSVIQLAIAILGCVFVLAVMTLPRSLDSWVISQIAKRLCDRISGYLKSDVAEEKIPDHVIKSLARLFLPDIIEFYSNEEDTAEPQKQKREAGIETSLPKC